MTASVVKPHQLLFRLRARDTPSGISRETLLRLSDLLGYSETQIMHLALAKLAKDMLPSYEADEGELTTKQLTAIRKAVPQGKARRVSSSLF